MADSQPQAQSLRRLLLIHELAFIVLVAVAGALGGTWAYFWQQTSVESIRLNGLSHLTQEIRSDLYRQVKEVTLVRLRDDPNAEPIYSASTKEIKMGFNRLRQRSVSRAEAYAVQAMQRAYSTIQVDMNAIFDDPYVLNRIVRSKLLDPNDEQVLVGEFELAFQNFRGLINQQLVLQAQKIKRWTRFAPVVILVPIVIAIVLLLFSRFSLISGFVRPVQALVSELRYSADGGAIVAQDAGAVAEVGEIARGINQMSRELADSRDALVDSERQAALGSLVPVVAHNIRNPLASIRATAQLLDARVSNSEIEESRSAIIQTVDRLERWVSALVSYLHPLQPHNQRISATSLLDATTRLLSTRLAEKSLCLVRDPWDDTLAVEVDPDLMEQVFTRYCVMRLKLLDQDKQLLYRSGPRKKT